ncbi:MAG: toll/interleukin-1 receptor domain-containing protein [Candidatus Zixiibacteriota bacterium]
MSKPSVFISYSHKDEKWVRDYLLANLEKNGISCHIDYRDFEVGISSIRNMARAIEKCEKTILVYTPDWIESGFTGFESLMLQTNDPDGERGKIIPIMLKECELPLELQVYTYADFTNPKQRKAELNRIITKIKRDFQIIETETPKVEYSPLDPANIDILRLPETGYELFGRQKELKLLNDIWDSDKTNVISFVAYGGVGKSTLVKKWVEKMRWDNYRGAQKVYAWSFYSQGTKEQVTSADMFISNALEWFGDPDPKKGSPWDKGKRLAKLINNHKTLMILDGLEPLQTAGKVEKGKIKDPALTTLVTELAKYNKGLCVITTREHVPELDRYTKKTNQLDLEQISDEAGRKLLETRRILGSEEELEHIVRQFGNHALAINLLAEYLHIFKDPLLEKANSIPDLVIPEEKGKHARRIIEAFANHFGSASAEFQLLSILGLFDRPVPIDAVNAIIRGKRIPGFSDQITDTTGSGWLTTLENLREHKLLLKKSEHRPDTLDCHPLIREHFGEKLNQQNSDAWKQAHGRLYEYYKSLPEKELPDTLEEMEPLFAAVMHGCLAGKRQEALYEIWYTRTQRGHEHYSAKKLGAFGANLSCLSNFFESPWDQPASGLREDHKAAILNWAGSALRAVGRLSEAAQPMKAALEIQSKNEDWSNSAIAASNLSELYLTLGDVASAQKYGAQCVTFADRSGDGFEMESRRTTQADALHQAAKNKAAEKLFFEAENMQKKRQPESLYLYSLWGFRFCDLLLSTGKYQEVLERARTTIKWVRNLLSIALDKLTIGKALMLQAVDESSSFSEALVLSLGEAENYLNQAVDGLREAGTQHNLPWGLLARATLFRHQKDFLKSWADLDEVREIAEYGQMRLFLTDYHLEVCRNIKEQLSAKDYQIIENGETLSLTKEEMLVRFKEHFKEAEWLIKETGYHRRDGELEELRKNPAK